MKKGMMYICFALVLCMALTSVSYAAEASKSAPKSFWQKLFNYPANVTTESATVVANTGKEGATVVVNEVKTVGSVVSGDADKAKDLVVDPITGTAEMAGTAAKDTVMTPYVASQTEAMPIEEATKDAVMATAKIASETTAGAVVDTADSTATTAKQTVTAPIKALETK